MMENMKSGKIIMIQRGGLSNIIRDWELPQKVSSLNILSRRNLSDLLAAIIVIMLLIWCLIKLAPTIENIGLRMCMIEIVMQTQVRKQLIMKSSLIRNLFTFPNMTVIEVFQILWMDLRQVLGKFYIVHSRKD